MGMIAERQEQAARRSFRIALTGGIASGKSIAAAWLASRGARVIDHDELSRALTGPGGAAMAPICAAFGSDAADASGGLDRARMRSRVFAEPAARRRLEAILHPMIQSEARTRDAAACADGLAVIVHDIPLLTPGSVFLRELPPDRIVVIDCPGYLQVKRASMRSGLDPRQVRAILAAQLPRSERVALADDLILNAGSLDTLSGSLDELWKGWGLADREHLV